MPGPSRNVDDIRLLRMCAKEHEVTLRTVSSWRKDNDPRWLDWKKARQGGRPRKEEEPPPELPDVEDDGLGEGIEPEIFRLMKECKRLAHKAVALEEAADFEAAALVHRILEAKRDSLRKLAKDNPDILERSGELLHKSVMLTHNQRLKTKLQNLARRLMAHVPDDLRPKIQTAMEKEVSDIFREIQEIELI